MPEELNEMIEQLDARIRALESAGADPWAAQPPTMYPPGPRPALEGPHLFPDEDEGFPAKIASDLTGGAYTFEEVYRLNATTWADLTGGRTGTAYEKNDVAGIAVGKKIWIHEVTDATGTLRYVFNFSQSIPSGTADKQMLAWDQTTHKAWELILPDGVWLDVDLATGRLIHIGPGAECYTGGCFIVCQSVDARGHIRWWYDNEANYFGPCAP